MSMMFGGTATVASGGVGLSSVHPLLLFSAHGNGVVAAVARGSITKGAERPATSDSAKIMAAGREAKTV